MKTTVPVGLVAPAVKAGVTVAVKATDWLTLEGLGDDTRLVVVEAALMTWLRMLEVADLKFGSPL